MTTLYRPVLIESAAQADALPSGTVATHGEGTAKLTAHRAGRSGSMLDAWMVMDEAIPNADMTGWTALVPVEVESEHEDEEFGVLSDRYSPPDIIPAIGWSGETAARRYRRTVIHTPWEEA